jgi:hypothetical protein
MECDYIINIDPGPTEPGSNGEKRNFIINRCTLKAAFFFIMEQQLIMRCQLHVNDDSKEVVIYIRGKKAIFISEEEAKTFEVLSV